MKLTLKDRVLILNAVLPQFDTRKNMELKISISSRIALSAEEEKELVISNVGNGQYEVSFKTANAITKTSDSIFTDEELMYLKMRVNYIDQNGMFSYETMETYKKILDCEFQTEEYILKWNEVMGIFPEVEPQNKE